jgi:hypothetical protein
MLESAQSDIVFWGRVSKWSVLGSAGCDVIDHPEELSKLLALNLSTGCFSFIIACQII